MRKKQKQIKIPKIILLLIVICIIIVIVSICKSVFNKSNNDNSNTTVAELDVTQYEDYEVPVAYFYYGIQNRDYDTFLKAYPTFMNISATFTEDDIQEFYNQVKDECGENIVLNFEIVSAEQYSQNSIDSLEEFFSTNYNVDITIQIAYIVEVKLTYTGDSGTVEQTIKQKVYKCNGEWYTL